jgi:hypothetical protein
MDSLQLRPSRNDSVSSGEKEGVSPRRSFSMRALHNCWVFQKEVEKARKLIRKNEYLSYVDEVVGESRFSNALQLARSLGA